MAPQTPKPSLVLPRDKRLLPLSPPPQLPPRPSQSSPLPPLPPPKLQPTTLQVPPTLPSAPPTLPPGHTTPPPGARPPPTPLHAISTPHHAIPTPHLEPPPPRPLSTTPVGHGSPKHLGKASWIWSGSWPTARPASSLTATEVSATAGSHRSGGSCHTSRVPGHRPGLLTTTADHSLHPCCPQSRSRWLGRGWWGRLPSSWTAGSCRASSPSACASTASLSPTFPRRLSRWVLPSHAHLEGLPQHLAAVGSRLALEGPLGSLHSARNRGHLGMEEVLCSVQVACSCSGRLAAGACGPSCMAIPEDRAGEGPERRQTRAFPLCHCNGLPGPFPDWQSPHHLPGPVGVLGGTWRQVLEPLSSCSPPGQGPQTEAQHTVH